MLLAQADKVVGAGVQHHDKKGEPGWPFATEGLGEEVAVFSGARLRNEAIWYPWLPALGYGATRPDAGLGRWFVVEQDIDLSRAVPDHKDPLQGATRAREYLRRFEF